MDAQLLKQSFTQIAPRKEEFARSFYQRLFSHFPETAPLFAKVDMAHQEKALMATLGAVVNGLAAGEDVSPAVKVLGKRHQGYGVLPDHFDAVGQSLLATLREFLGTSWTTELETSWGEAYGTLASLMKAEIVLAN
jgi:methyl-accepting chemotaxis protein